MRIASSVEQREKKLLFIRFGALKQSVCLPAKTFICWPGDKSLQHSESHKLWYAGWGIVCLALVAETGVGGKKCSDLSSQPADLGEV